MTENMLYFQHGNHRAKGGFTPLFYSEGSGNPPDERKEGDAMVTYGDMFAYTLVLIGVAGLCIQIVQFRNKKK